MGDCVFRTMRQPGGGLGAWHAPPPMETDPGRDDRATEGWVAALAGGRGTRLQQPVRHIMGRDRPKRFCRIVGTRSMLRQTWDRTRQIVPPERILTGITADRDTAAHLFASGYFRSIFVLAGHLQAFLRAARRILRDVLESLSAAAAFLGRRYEADVLPTTYRSLRPIDFSRTLLAGRPEVLSTMHVRGVCWSDWGDPQRILRTRRRFDRRPAWLPVYPRALAQGADVVPARSQ